MELLRSLMFVPGNRADMLEKAVGFEADALMPDLEDSVPLPEKAHARGVVAQALPALAKGKSLIIVRVNALTTGLMEDDLAAVVGPFIHGVGVPKTESAWDVQQADAILERLERQRGLPPGQVRLAVWVETAKAVVRAWEICSASPRAIGVCFGAEDLTVDMGTKRTDEGEEVLYARSAVAVAAHAADILAFDTPYVNFRDPEGLRRDTAKGVSLGYQGKFAIHPGQLSIINELFAPTPEEVDYARRVVQAAQEAEAEGRGATSLDDRMIDAPVVKRAQRVLAAAESIAARTGSPGAS